MTTPPSWVTQNLAIKNPQSPQAQGLVAWWPTASHETTDGLFDREDSHYLSFGAGGARPSRAQDPLMGQIVSFDGGDDAYANDHDNLDPSHLSISMWVKRTGVQSGTLGHVIAKYDDPTTGGWSLVYDKTSDQYKFYINDGTDWQFAASGSGITQGEWFHVVGTFDGSTIRIYVNGVEGTSASQSALVATANALHVGKHPAVNTDYFVGDFADIRVYQRTLTADEIWQMWAAETRWDLYAPVVSAAKSIMPAAAQISSPARSVPVEILAGFERNDRDRGAVGLVGWWTAIGGSSHLFTSGRTIVEKSRYRTSFVMQGGNTQRGTDSLFGNTWQITDAATDGGTSGLATTTAYPNLVNVTECTVSAWVKPTSTNSTLDGHIFNKRNGANPGTIALVYRTSGKWMFQVRLNGSEGTARNIESDSVATLNRWYHVIGVYDGTTLTMYVDGVAQSSTLSVSGAIDTDSFTDVNIGFHPTGGQFKGHIGEVRLYNRAMDAAEAWSLWAAETRWDLYAPAVPRALGLVPTAASIPPPQSSRPSQLVAGFSLNRVSPQAMGLKLWVPAIAPEIAEAGSLYDLAGGRAGTFAAAGSPSIIYDPELSGVLDFDGTNDTLDYPDEDYGLADHDTNAFTAAFWVKKAQDASRHDVMVFRDAGTPTGFNISIGAFNAGALEVDAHDGSVNNQFIDNLRIDDGHWHHVAVTFSLDKNQVRVFVDGVRRINSTTTHTAGMGSRQLRFGAAEDGTNKFTGQLTDMRLYNLALPDEVIWQMWAARTRWSLYDGHTQQAARSMAVIPVRVTQAGVEAIVLPSPPPVRVTQAGVEILTWKESVGHITTVGLEAITDLPATDVRLTQSGIEVITKQLPNEPQPFYPPQLLTGFTIRRNSNQAIGLLGWWPASGSGGIGQLSDYSGYGRHGTWAGNPQWVHDPSLGSVLDLDGTSDYVSLPSTVLSQISPNQGSLAVWYTADNLGAALSEAIVSLRVDANNNIEILTTSSASTISMKYKAGGTEKTVTTPSLDTGKWYLAVLTWDTSADEVKGYHNGVLQSALSTLGAWSGSLSFGAIGYANSADTYFDGRVADVRVYNRILGPDEIWGLWDVQTRWDLYMPMVWTDPFYWKPVALTDIRLSQLAAEVLFSSPDTPLRVSQLSAEVLQANAVSSGRLTQLIAEIIAQTDVPSVRLTQLMAEVISNTPASSGTTDPPSEAFAWNELVRAIWYGLS